MGASGETEKTGGEYLQRYKSIIEAPLSPENIDTYADNAMDKLGELIADIQEKYRWEGIDLSDKEREDRVFAEALPGESVEGTLDRIDEVAQDLRGLDGVIQEVRSNPENQVILPPDEVEIAERTGEGGGESWVRAVLPKLKTTLFVLEQDFGLDVRNPEEVKLSMGVVEPRMMRGMSYDVIELPEMERLILTCDESGNRTFVFDTAKLAENNITIEMLKSGRKSQLTQLLQVRPEVGKGIVYSPNYVERVRGAIENPAGELAAEKEMAEGAEYLKVGERAPEGWMARSGLARKLGATVDAINKYYDENADKIGATVSYISAGGQPAEFFSPEQIEAFRQYFEGRKEKRAPEGWMTRRNVAEALGVTVSTITKYYDAHADEIGSLTVFINARGKQYEFFSPEQIEKLKQHFGSRGEKAPNGWMTAHGLAVELGTSNQLVMDYYNAHMSEVGSLTTYISNDQNRVYEYFSPKQIAMVREFFGKRGEKAPEGWKTMRGIAVEHGFTPRVLKKHYTRHKDEIGLPQEYLNAQGRKFEYFSPEQAEKMVEYAKSAEE